jgi:hypothetical protein
MSVKALLDDAAAAATAGLRIDLAAAKRRSDERRAAVRRRATAAMVAGVAVAAIVALITVLLPGAVFRAVPPAAPTDRPTGLPDRWYYAPPWTPPVTRHPMAAASMVLASPLQVSWRGRIQDGPVLVSADGTQYASLPWGRWDSMVSLAPSGRDVGWISQSDGRPGAPKRSVVHRIRLSDGRQRDATLPAGVRVDRLLWQGDRLFVSPVGVATGKSPGWVLTPGSDLLHPVAEVPALMRQPVRVGHGDKWGDPNHPGGDAIALLFATQDPDDQRTVDVIRKASGPAGSAEVPSTFTVTVTGSAARAVEIPIVGADPITDVQVLGWAEGGIVLRVHSENRLANESVSLRLANPDGSTTRIVSRQRATRIYPVAVATEVVGAGTIVPGAPPEFSSGDRSHLQFLAGRGYSLYGSWISSGALLLLAGLVVLLVRRRQTRRRRAGSA